MRERHCKYLKENNCCSLSLSIGQGHCKNATRSLIINVVAPLDAQSTVATVITATLTPSPGTIVKITKTFAVNVAGSSTALEVYNEPLTRGGEAKVRLKVNNLGSAQMEFLTSENSGPTKQVKVNLRDEDGNLLATGNLKQVLGNVVNAGTYALARMSPSGSFLSEPVTFIVPSNAPYKLALEAVIENTYYHYNKPDAVVAPGMKLSTVVTIVEAPYSAIAKTDKTIYKQGESVIISGKALSTATGAPAPNAPVKIGVSVKGFDRFYSATTDSSGNFAYAFKPGASEAGTFSVWSAHPDVNDRAVQAQFAIVAMDISPKIANVTMSKNRSFDVPVTIKNLSDVTLGNLAVAVACVALPGTQDAAEEGMCSIHAKKRLTLCQQGLQ